MNNIKNLSNCNKTILLKIILYYESITNINILETIKNKIDCEENNFKKELMIAQFNLIIKEIENIKYIKKEEHDDYTIYYYNKYIHIFIKHSDYSYEKILEFIKTQNFIKITITKKNKNQISFLTNQCEDISIIKLLMSQSIKKICIVIKAD
jgi:hypothetical protein